MLKRIASAGILILVMGSIILLSIKFSIMIDIFVALVSISSVFEFCKAVKSLKLFQIVYAFCSGLSVYGQSGLYSADVLCVYYCYVVYACFFSRKNILQCFCIYIQYHAAYNDLVIGSRKNEIP